MANKFLILQLGKLGDVVLTTPLFYNLKKLYPDSKITLICSDYSSGIIENNPYIDNVFKFRKSFSSYVSLFYFLRKNIFDYYIDINPERSSTSKYFLKFVRAEIKIGFGNNNPDFDIHLERYKQGNHYTELSTSPIKYFSNEFEINRTPTIFVKTASPKNSKPYIFVNSSAGKNSRIWEAENYLNLVNRIGMEFDFNIVIDSYRNKELRCELLKLKLSNLYLPDLNLKELCNMIYNAELIITPDTSVVHIASAYNKNIVCMFNKVDWNIERFYPMSDKAEVLISDSEENLRSITPEMILESVRKIFGGNAGSRTRVRNEDH